MRKNHGFSRCLLREKLDSHCSSIFPGCGATPRKTKKFCDTSSKSNKKTIQGRSSNHNLSWRGERPLFALSNPSHSVGEVKTKRRERGQPNNEYFKS